MWPSPKQNIALWSSTDENLETFHCVRFDALGSIALQAASWSHCTLLHSSLPAFIGAHTNPREPQSCPLIIRCQPIMEMPINPSYEPMVLTISLETVVCICWPLFSDDDSMFFIPWFVFYDLMSLACPYVCDCITTPQTASWSHCTLLHSSLPAFIGAHTNPREQQS